ncbi:MAG: hypothetical protein HYV59_05700 [Planctomycetes bacterium]|nr:hypothetical protein [Planctomycetota bacterium]
MRMETNRVFARFLFFTENVIGMFYTDISAGTGIGLIQLYRYFHFIYACLRVPHRQAGFRHIWQPQASACVPG